MTITLDPSDPNYSCGLDVRYNKHTVAGLTEKTSIIFNNNGIYIDRANSSLLEDASKRPTHTWPNAKNEYQVTILMDRSMLEVYIDGVISFTTRIYPKYGDSDYLHFFDNNANLIIKDLTVISMKSAYSDKLTPPYYGNVGNLGDLGGNE